MRRLIKPLLVVLGLFIVAAAAAPLLLKRFLPPERVRELIVSSGRRALGRELKLSGVSYSLLRGLTLEGLAVSESPDFQAGEALSARRFNIRPRLLPLLRKQVVVDSVSADGLRVVVIRRKDGKISLLEFGSAPGANAPSSSRAGDGSLPLTVKNARLTQAAIAYRDERTGDAFSASPVDVRLRGFRLDGSFELELSASFSGRQSGRPLAGSLEYAGRVDLGGNDPRKLKAEFKRLNAGYGEWRVSAFGKLAGLERTTASVKFKAAHGGQDLVDGAFEGIVVASGPALAGELMLRSGGVPRERLKALGVAAPLAAPAFSLSGRVDGGQDAVAVKNLVIEPKGLGRLQLDGNVANLRSGKPRADLTFDAKLTLPAFSAADLPGAGLPAGLAVPALSVAGAGRVRGESLALERLQVSGANGGVELSGAVDALTSATPKPDLQVKLELELPAFTAKQAPWLKLPAGSAVPAMKISGALRARGDELGLAGVKVRTKAGTVELNGSVDKLRSAPRADVVASADLNIPGFAGNEAPWLKLPAGVAVPAFSLSGKARVRGDDVTLDGVKVRGAAGGVSVSGALKGALAGRVDPALELEAKLSLPALKSAEIPLPGVPPGLELPASSWDVSASGGLDELKIKTLRLVAGNNDVELTEGRLLSLRSSRPLLNVLIKCRKFALDELTRLSPATRDMGLSGSGFFAMNISGKWPKPILQGKMQFKGLGATVAGLKLSEFTGTASFDERRIDIPNLSGKLAEGALKVDFTAKNYATAPAIDLQAELSDFDLSAYLKAKAALTQPKTGASAMGAADPAAASPPIAAKGRLTVEKLRHANMEASDVRVSWDLTGLGPDLRKLNGGAKFGTAAGKLRSLGAMASESKLVKVLTMPFAVIQSIGKIGGLKLFPDFNNIDFSEAAGDYGFRDGVMQIAESHLYASVGNVAAVGSIDLPIEKLDLTATAKVGSLAPLDVEIKGTFDKPQSKVKLGKFVAEPAKQLLQKVFSR